MRNDVSLRNIHGLDELRELRVDGRRLGSVYIGLEDFDQLAGKHSSHELHIPVWLSVGIFSRPSSRLAFAGAPQRPDPKNAQTNELGPVRRVYQKLLVVLELLLLLGDLLGRLL